jgi:uncharacterized protein (TIGR02452 family)
VAQRVVADGLRMCALCVENSRTPRGGVHSGAAAQEEYTCRRANGCERTAHWRATRNACRLGHPSFGDHVIACYYNDVKVLRAGASKGYSYLEHPFEIDVLVMAATFQPELSGSINGVDCKFARVKLAMASRVDLMMGIAAQRAPHFACSAFGRGAFGNPPEEAACVFGTTLQQLPSFPITFAVLDDHNTLRLHNPRGISVPFRSNFTTCATDAPRPSSNCPPSFLTWTCPILRTAET